MIDPTFTTPAPSSTWFGGPHSGGSSNQSLNPSVGYTVDDSLLSPYNQPSPSHVTDPRYVSGATGQQMTGKATLVPQRYQNTEQPVRFEDSVIRFNATRVQEVGPPRLPTKVPPT